VIEAVALVAGFAIVVAVAFVFAVRLGILVGRRLDRALEARAATTQTADAVGEEHRGE
jgi:hypothetical protein